VYPTFLLHKIITEKYQKQGLQSFGTRQYHCGSYVGPQLLCKFRVEDSPKSPLLCNSFSSVHCARQFTELQ